MQEIIKNNEERMQRRINHLNDEFKTIRAGRANAGVLDKVMVDYYGVPTPINQLAAVSVTEARTLSIQPWDKSVIKLVEKAIQMSDIGINPQNDGSVIRLIFPPLTEEKRKDIAKEIASIAEDTKVQIRNVRRESNDKLEAKEKSSDITEDDLKQGKKKIQDATDKFIKEVDEIAAKKKKEIMEI